MKGPSFFIEAAWFAENFVFLVLIQSSLVEE